MKDIHVEDTEVLLPQTQEQLDDLITTLSKEYGFPVNDETTYSITRIILNLPPDKAYVTKTALGHGTLRGIAQNIVYPKHEEARKRLVAVQEAKEKEEKTKAGLSLVKDETKVDVTEPLQGA